MRKGAPKYPQPRDVAPVFQAIKQFIPMDSSPVYGMWHSLKNVPCFRLRGVTKEVLWTVDVYRGHFYHVQIDGKSETIKSIPALVVFLRQRLQV